MRIIDRLIQYLEHKKITPYAFERACQVANGYLKKQHKGKGSIGSDILIRIHENYIDLSLIWLIAGEGDMLNPVKESDEKNILNDDPRQYYTKDEMIRILQQQVELLETALTDKEKIIVLLEARERSLVTN